MVKREEKRTKLNIFMCMFFIKESIWQRCQIFHMTSWLSEQAVYLSLCPTNISVKLSILCFSSVAQGCLGDTGPTDRVPGLHRLRFTHYPPDRSDTWHHSRAAFHFHGHPVLTRIPVGQEGNQSCPPGCLLDVDTINCTFPVFLLLASHALPPLVLLLPARLLMSLTITQHGVVFTGADEVTFTPACPLKPSPPLSLKPRVVNV